MKRLALTMLLALAPAARGDLLSPGDLSKAHAKLEGLSNCTQCHVKGGQVSEQRCLDCHRELQQRVTQKKGFHGLLQPAERSCNQCHHEHQGRDFELIEWPAGGENKFDHRKTGYPLNGKHAQTQCARCHMQRLVIDAAVRKLVAERPGRTTFLGLPAQCASCHFDEHRKQMQGACSSCHNEKGWKPAPGFSHAKTDFPLKGKHVKVECLQCHATVKDPQLHKDAPLPPKSEVFATFRPVAHGSCVDCHKDPHDGRLGADCMGCHTVDGWTEMRGATGQRAFHEKTRYPLRGAHVDVACRSCHGPFPGMAALFKGLKFDSCTSCHVDAHVGQLGKPPPACDSCHALQAFLPVRYDPARHLKYPLEGAHQAVACSACHRTDTALAARAAPLRAWIEKRKRSDPVSLTQFHPPAPAGRCDSCHRDPHRGQFDERVQQAGCGDCHQVSSFAMVRFDHSRESRFPLTGAHTRALCEACHVADASRVVRYKPLQTACASCHADPHAGQFATAAGARADCAACHLTQDWKTTQFVHRAPFTSFELDGKHQSVACAACHRDFRVAGVVVRQYRGLPVTCAGCHVDVHRGAFREVSQ